MKDLYGEGYWEYGIGSNYRNYADDSGWVPTVEVLLQHVETPASLFEFASAKGYFLRAAREAGLDAYGMDISSWAVRSAVTPVFKADAADPNLVEKLGEERGYDIVCSWEFLEHVPHDELVPVLKNMLALTEPGCFFVHRIGTTTVEGVRQDDDHTHVSNHTYDWWYDFLVEEAGNLGYSLYVYPYLVEDLNDQFKGRDWSGRFFAFVVQQD